MKEKGKRILVIIAVILAILVLAYLVDLETIIDILLSANLPLITLSTIFMIAGFILVSVRLRLILGEKISLQQTFYGDALGFMTTPFLPIPTPVLRAIGIERTTPLKASLVSSALAIDYLLGFVMRFFSVLLLVFLVPSALDSGWSIVWGILLLILLLGGLIWIVNRLDQFFNMLDRLARFIPRIDKEQVRQSLAGVRMALESAGSTRNLLISVFYTLMIMLCFALYQYFALAAFPLGLSWRQMLAISMAVLVVVPPTAPLMIGAYQGVLVGSLIWLQILNVNTLTAYAILLQTMQIIFWLIAGSFALMRTRFRLGELIHHADKKKVT